MANITERTPITITLGNLLKAFTNKGISKNTKYDRLLLGKACDYLYEDIKEGSVSIDRIRNCINQKKNQSYTQAYNGYERLAMYYFYELMPDSNSADDGVDSSKNKPLDESVIGKKKEHFEKKMEEVVELRSFILNAWIERLKEPFADYDTLVNNCLMDASLISSEVPGIVQIRAFLEEYQQAQENNDRAEILTVVTILAATRGQWHKLPYATILPKEYKTREQLTDMSEFELRYLEAMDFYSEGDYQDALEKLENLELMNIFSLKTKDETDEEIEDPSTKKRLELFNRKVVSLRCKVRRKLVRFNCETDEEREEMEESLRYDLEDAIDEYHSTEMMLVVAREYYEEQPYSVFSTDESKCIELCKKIIDNYPEAVECGEAAYMLSKLIEDVAFSDVYLKKAYDYSYDKAVREYKEKHAVSLTSTIDRSNNTSCGFYCFNEENVYSEFIKQSAPTEWNLVSFPVAGNVFTCNSDNMWKKINENVGNQRFFLISSDFERNLQELLHLLQTIKNNFNATSIDLTAKMNIPFEFYIRGQEEKIGPFIDTALARIENVIIPVHIIDDDKMSARVLAQHPLFYSIRQLSENEAALLKFVVVGNTKVCEWLIREASWMLTFRNQKLKTEIIIIAPDADSVKDHIKFKCPDIDTTKLGITAKKAGYETEECLRQIKGAIESGYAYFAVDIGSDIDNMSMATKIRECCIRKKIQSNADDVSDLPVIVFHCNNADIANLSQGTVVINENWGNKWFNNYAVIPFGRIDSLYQWDSLTNHTLEQLSLNSHLQYYLQDGPANENTTKKAKEDYHNALKDYYGRTYNRDSSLAVAMSLPYRLYQGIVDQGTNDAHRIIPPEPINILDPDTFYSEDTRIIYADWIEKIGWEHGKFTEEIEQDRMDSYGSHEKYMMTRFDAKSEVYQMAEWEQERWNRFMISRGWTSATTKQMQFYFDAGNQSQQLYIGRMHPCIEDFGKLQDINDKYTAKKGKDKGLHMSNITSIQRTEKLLTLHWVKKARALVEKNDVEQERG